MIWSHERKMVRSLGCPSVLLRFPRFTAVGVLSSELPKSSLVIEEMPPVLVLSPPLVIKTIQLPASLMAYNPVGYARLPRLPRLTAVGTLSKLLVNSNRVIVLFSAFTVKPYQLLPSLNRCRSIG